MPGGSPSPSRSLQHEIGKKRPFDSAEQEAHLNIQRSAACLAMPFERLFREHGLSEATYNALRILRGHLPAGVPSQTIGEHLIAQVPDVTRLVDRLVASGLAERCRIEADRRVVMVKITKAGLDLLGKLDKPVRELHAMQLGHLSPAELSQLSRLLVKARRLNLPRE